MIVHLNNRWCRFTCYMLLVACCLFSNCQKEIVLELPSMKQKICVDGKIEEGVPPYVILTRNMPYFGAMDANALQNMFIHNAVVKVYTPTTTITLTEYCSQSLPSSLLPLVASFTGVDTTALKKFNYCVYTTLNPADTGTTGVTYNLTVDVDGKSLNSSTTIFKSIPLDSTWYQYEKINSEGDSLGFVWAHFTDPPQQGNAYRWLAKTQGADFSFIPPFASAFDDKFINDKSFDFAYARGHLPNNGSAEQEITEYPYYKQGDTVIIKFCTIDRGSFDFFRQMDVVLSNQGNPFAAPTSVPGNVYPRTDALGVWCGYGTFLDTVIFK